MNAILSLLVAPLTAGDLVTIMGAFFGGVIGIIYALRGKTPADLTLPQTVNRLGTSVVNMQKTVADIALATPSPARSVAPAPGTQTVTATTTKKVEAITTDPKS